MTKPLTEVCRTVKLYFPRVYLTFCIISYLSVKLVLCYLKQASHAPLVTIHENVLWVVRVNIKPDVYEGDRTSRTKVIAK